MPARYLLGPVALALAASGLLPAQAQSSALEAGFADPPHEFSLVPYWAWNGTLEPEELKRQIDEMVDKGVYAAFMHARPGIESSDTPYFSEGWWDAVRTCVEYGPKAGFTPWLYDEDKWPSGSAGGRVLERNPERNRQKVLRRIEQRVTGPRNVRVSIPDARYIIAGRLTSDQAFAPGSLIDLTDHNTAGAAPWVCPEGEWLLTGYVYEPFRDEINYMNPETVRDFIDITHEAYARRYGDHLGDTFPGIFFDEIGMTAGTSPDRHVWAEGFAERFQQMHGYDLIPELPALVRSIGPRTPIIRCDYYETFTAMYEEAWFKQLSDWCAARGMKLTGHTIEELNRYVKQGDYMQTLRHLQIPTTDNEDFRYTWPRTIGAWKPKQAASISHLYGYPQTGVEALGGAGWPFNLDMARYGFNMLAAYGVTYHIPHFFAYANDTPANADDWPNSWFFRNPYWKYFKTLADTVRRTSYVLYGGEPIVDVAVLYPQCNQWSGYGPGTIEETIIGLTAMPIDTDVIDPPSLLSAGIGPGRLEAGPMTYRSLILPGLRCLRRAEADQVRRFAEAGGLVIVHDRWPVDSPEFGTDDPYLVEFARRMEEQGIYPCAPSETAARIEAAIGRDLRVVAGDPAALRYSHVNKDDKAIYWVTNGAQNAGRWRIAFRAVGAPSRWQPEDGRITPIETFVRRGDITECTVPLDGWQGCFIVFDQAQVPPEGGILLAPSPYRDVHVTNVEPSGIGVSALVPSNAGTAAISGTHVQERTARAVAGTAEVAGGPAALTLDGMWQFLPVGNALDTVWRASVPSAELALPVIRFHWVRGAEPDGWTGADFEDARWRQVKVVDTLNKKQGADRYRSRWDGRFITWQRYHPFDLERFFVPFIGGKDLECRKTFLLPPGVTRGRIAVVCPGPFTVQINGTEAGSGKGGAEGIPFTFDGLKAGENTVIIQADDAEALLAEGAFMAEYGAAIPFFTDGTWEARIAGEDWTAAWEYLAPPEAPFGEPLHPWNHAEPGVLLYRADLPPGASAVGEPRIEGTWAAWVDGQPLAFDGGVAPVPPGTGVRALAIRVVLDAGARGLMSAIPVHCVPADAPLVSWTESGLDWYSGRAQYARTFTLDDTWFPADGRIEIDLGRVNFCAEIWVNNQLAGTRVWPPYRLDITDFARPGENRVDIVVANLIANQKQWDIFDRARASLQSRKWHYDGIQRDAWCLESGLLGPVRIQPYKRVDIAAIVE